MKFLIKTSLPVNTKIISSSKTCECSHLFNIMIDVIRNVTYPVAKTHTQALQFCVCVCDYLHLVFMHVIWMYTDLHESLTDSIKAWERVRYTMFIRNSKVSTAAVRKSGIITLSGKAHHQRWWTNSFQDDCDGNLQACVETYLKWPLALD